MVKIELSKKRRPRQYLSAQDGLAFMFPATQENGDGRKEKKSIQLRFFACLALLSGAGQKKKTRTEPLFWKKRSFRIIPPGRRFMTTLLWVRRCVVEDLKNVLRTEERKNKKERGLEKNEICPPSPPFFFAADGHIFLSIDLLFVLSSIRKSLLSEGEAFGR